MRYLFLYILGTVIFFSCDNKNTTTDTGPVSDGKAAYIQYCVTCHGENGAKMSNGAPNLQTSTLAKRQIMQQIKNGSPEKGMIPYRDIISGEKVEHIADFLLTLQQ